jgi:hypothetical protein
VKTHLFTVDEAQQMTEQVLQPADLLPKELPAACEWARPSIVSVIGAFYLSRYFQVQPGTLSSNYLPGAVEITFDLIAVNRGTSHRHGKLTVEVSPKHLCITVKSIEVPFNAKKRWMHGYTHRPKWKKFGTWACKGLLLRQVHEEVFEVMES